MASFSKKDQKTLLQSTTRNQSKTQIKYVLLHVLLYGLMSSYFHYNKVREDHSDAVRNFWTELKVNYWTAEV